MSQSSIINRWGTFGHLLYRADGADRLHSAVILGTVRHRRVPVRVHSECLTGDVFGSRRCDCGEQLDSAFQAIQRAGRGIIIYLRGHEGRGIGLSNKLKAYALQDKGYDTVDANAALGLPVDSRSYEAATSMLHLLMIREALLMTNNPDKTLALKQAEIRCTPIPMPSISSRDNHAYLQAKAVRMGHSGLIR